jgi:hypothetical protein
MVKLLITFDLTNTYILKDTRRWTSVKRNYPKIYNSTVYTHTLNFESNTERVIRGDKNLKTILFHDENSICIVLNVFWIHMDSRTI